MQFQVNILVFIVEPLPFLRFAIFPQSSFLLLFILRSTYWLALALSINFHSTVSFTPCFIHPWLTVRVLFPLFCICFIAIMCSNFLTNEIPSYETSLCLFRYLFSPYHMYDTWERASYSNYVSMYDVLPSPKFEMRVCDSIFSNFSRVCASMPSACVCACLCMDCHLWVVDLLLRIPAKRRCIGKDYIFANKICVLRSVARRKGVFVEKSRKLP